MTSLTYSELEVLICLHFTIAETRIKIKQKELIKPIGVSPGILIQRTRCGRTAGVLWTRCVGVHSWATICKRSALGLLGLGIQGLQYSPKEAQYTLRGS